MSNKVNGAHFQHRIEGKRISSCSLSSKLSCLGFSEFEGNETCKEQVLLCCMEEVYAQALYNRH